MNKTSINLFLKIFFVIGSCRLSAGRREEAVKCKRRDFSKKKKESTPKLKGSRYIGSFFDSLLYSDQLQTNSLRWRCSGNSVLHSGFDKFLTQIRLNSNYFIDPLLGKTNTVLSQGSRGGLSGLFNASM